MPKPSDTKQRILDTARELFSVHGVQKTSLQDIADRLGITKPALYYHFASREELVRTIVQPLIVDGENFLTGMRERDHSDPQGLLEGFFDFNYRHRAEVIMLLTEMPTLAELNLIDRVLALRSELGALLLGPDPTLAQQVRAVMALGGMQDVCMQFPDVPEAELRTAAVEAARAALGIT